MNEAVDLSRPCSKQSLAAGEPIAGSATASVRAWLLIEHRGRWERDIASTEMPQSAHRWLAGLLNRHRHLRPQLIRRPSDHGPLHVFVVLTDRTRRIRRFTIDSHDELADLPVETLVEGSGDAGAPGPEALYLVCTHGRRDLCCSRHGVAFHKALSEQSLDGELWQSSHQGGHRFAATMVYLPSGIQYGRLLPEEAAMVAEAHKQGEVYALNRYRGQTRLSAPIQAAEAWLRQELGMMAFDGLTLIERKLVDRDADRWTAQFRAPDSLLHRLTVEPRHGQLARLASCGDEEATPARWYYVVRHEAQTT